MSANPAAFTGHDAMNASSRSFVINLCASTSPMALSHPSAPELKRYTFFVSRQREDGRDRFRLHMGYFSSQEEAEKLLEAVRDVYPAAWAGLAPSSGAPRRGRMAPVAVKGPELAAVPSPVAAPAAVAPAPAPIVVVAPVAVAPAPAVEPTSEVLSVMSNVRDVLARLDAAPVPRLEPAAAAPALSEPQVLSVLEAPVAAVKAPARRAVPGQAAAMEETEVRVVTPEDTQTLKDISLDEQNNAPKCFAVQLVWSVSPIDVASLPHLAIFDAYNLYNVEGSRQGRKWYGLRLGFFSDPNSATQVANYVRSDYRSVAIVPVAIKERDGAGGGDAAVKGAPTARLGEALNKNDTQQIAVGADALQGFELLEDDRPVAKKMDLDDKPAAAKAAAPVAKAAAAAAPKLPPKIAAKLAPRVPGKAVGKPSGKRVVVRKRPDAPLARTAPGAPTPLESTLEILGASTLTLDDSRAIINDSAVRQPVNRKPVNRFSKLLSRLSGN
jgi:hypothetical protein